MNGEVYNWIGVVTGRNHIWAPEYVRMTLFRPLGENNAIHTFLGRMIMFASGCGITKLQSGRRKDTSFEHFCKEATEEFAESQGYCLLISSSALWINRDD